MDGSEEPSTSEKQQQIIIKKSQDKNNNPSSLDGGNLAPPPQQWTAAGLHHEEVEKSPGCSIPTINFKDFVSLLSPNNVENCLCCSTSLLLNSGPPPLLPQKKGAILKSFCDILNLPFKPPSNSTVKDANNKHEQGGGVELMEDATAEDNVADDDEDEEVVDFPFCFHCTNKKVLLLTVVHQQLEALQAKFDQLKDTIMKDVVRGFVSNIVTDKKIPVHVMREAKICERMFHLFKSHSERRPKKDMVESETQTDISSVFTPLMNPAAVASLLENASLSQSSSSSQSFNNKRRKPVPSIHNTSSNFKTWNHNTRHSSSTSTNLNNNYNSRSNHRDYKLNSSSLKSATSTTTSSYYDGSNNSHMKINTQTSSLIEESIVPFDDNGGMFPFDDNGILSMGGDNNDNDTYMPSTDYYNLSKPISYVHQQQHSTLNGFSTIDDEFQNALGLDSSVVAAPRTSPLIYTDLDSVMVDDEDISQPQQLLHHHHHSTGRKKFAQCEVCDKVMLKGTIKMHMEQIHGGERPYKCRGCDKRFARRDHFNSHEEHHIVNSKRTYYCHRCVDKDEIIISKTSYVAHCMDVHGIEDDVVEYFYFCDKEDCRHSYKVREDFINHVKSHWKNLGESNNCGTCDKVFSGKNRLIAHEVEVHGARKSFFDCQFCHMGFEEEDDFSRHLLFHKVKMPDELQYHCEQCERHFETANRLRRHIYTIHVRGRSKKAGNKSKRRSSKQEEEEHKMVNDYDDDEDSMNDDDDDNESTMDKPDYPCEECGKLYATEKKLMKHVQKHHTENKSKSRNKKVNNDDGPSSDDDVPDAGGVENADKEDEDYPSPGGLTTKRKGRRRGSTLNNNSSSSSGGRSCTFCPSKFKTAIELRRHVARSHPKERLKGDQVFCIVCFKVFENQQELDDHCDEKHSRSKCRICNKQFQSTGILKQHMERHKAHPFICKLCDHGFATKSNLKKHITRSHPKQPKVYNGESNSPADSLQLHYDQNSFDLDSVDLFKM